MKPAPTGTAPSVDPGHFRYVVGHLASGVTVVTTEADRRRHGMTASSVTSLSMDPPMMLACINNAVPTADAVAVSGKYVVNVLGEHQGELARQFATASRDKFHDVAVHTGMLGLPLLSDALAHIECEVAERVVGGTHTIFLGRVVSATAASGQPLTYFRGGFGRFEFARDDVVYTRARELVLSRVYPATTRWCWKISRHSLKLDESAWFYALTRLIRSTGATRPRPWLRHRFLRCTLRLRDVRRQIRHRARGHAVAMGRVTPEEVAELRLRFDAMAALLVGDRFVDFHGYLDANYSFHEHLVSLAHNPLLTSTFGRLSIKTVMTRSFGSTPVTSQKFVEAQRQLVEAFECRDRAAAEQAAIRILRAREGASPRDPRIHRWTPLSNYWPGAVRADSDRVRVPVLALFSGHLVREKAAPPPSVEPLARRRPLRGPQRAEARADRGRSGRLTTPLGWPGGLEGATTSACARFALPSRQQVGRSRERVPARHLRPRTPSRRRRLHQSRSADPSASPSLS